MNTCQLVPTIGSGADGACSWREAAPGGGLLAFAASEREDRTDDEETACGRLLLVSGEALEPAGRAGDLTPLMAAARAGRAGLVGWLAAQGAPLDTREGQGWTVLHFSVVSP